MAIEPGSATGVRLAGPNLTVVVPSVNGYDDLEGCLAALSELTVACEVVVVDRTGELTRHYVARDFPDVVVLPAAPDQTIPEMRATGIRRASAHFVGVIEDHVIVPPDWGRAMIDAMAPGIGAVGGSVVNAATGSLIDWAAFLCEYSGTLPPLPEGPSNWLPGNNVVYRRDTLSDLDEVLDQNRWEDRLHDAIRARGEMLLLCPEISVGHKMHYSFGLYMSQRYLYSRSYSGMRAKGMPGPKRIALGLASLVALPPLMFLRTVSRIVTKGGHHRELLKSLPLLVCFVLSWGAGEAVGYWFGPGRSLSRIR